MRTREYACAGLNQVHASVTKIFVSKLCDSGLLIGSMNAGEVFDVTMGRGEECRISPVIAIVGTKGWDD